MWSWFSRSDASDVVPKLTCADVMELAGTMAWDEWTTFLVLSRDHDINSMSRAAVLDLLDQMKRGAVDLHPDACTPRQLTEFLYLLTPARWQVFSQFAATVSLNELPFSAMLVQFLAFEAEQAARVQPAQ